MAISKALEAKILRYHFVEHWGENTMVRGNVSVITIIDVVMFKLFDGYECE